MLERTLQAEGYDTRTASDGGAALATAESWPPHAIVLDVVMPGIDGHAVARRLRHKGDAVPILLLTARDEVATAWPASTPAPTTTWSSRSRRMSWPPGCGRCCAEATRPSRPISHGDLTVDPATRVATRAGTSIELTGREAALLALLVATPARSSAATRRSTPSGATAACPPPTPSTATSPTCAASSARRR